MNGQMPLWPLEGGPKFDKMKRNFQLFWKIISKWAKSEEKLGGEGYFVFSPPPLGNPSYATASADLLVFFIFITFVMLKEQSHNLTVE